MRWIRHGFPSQRAGNALIFPNYDATLKQVLPLVPSKLIPEPLSNQSEAVPMEASQLLWLQPGSHALWQRRFNGVCCDGVLGEALTWDQASWIMRQLLAGCSLDGDGSCPGAYHWQLLSNINGMLLPKTNCAIVRCWAHLMEFWCVFWVNCLFCAGFNQIHSLDDNIRLIHRPGVPFLS